MNKLYYNYMGITDLDHFCTDVVLEVERMCDKDNDRLFDLPPKSELYLKEDDSNEGLKGFIHKILFHKDNDVTKYKWEDCIYHRFLSSNHYTHLENHLSEKEDIIWWVDKDDEDYKNLNTFLEDLYSESIKCLNKRLNLGMDFKKIGKDFVI